MSCVSSTCERGNTLFLWPAPGWWSVFKASSDTTTQRCAGSRFEVSFRTYGTRHPIRSHRMPLTFFLPIGHCPWPLTRTVVFDAERLECFTISFVKTRWGFLKIGLWPRFEKTLIGGPGSSRNWRFKPSRCLVPMHFRLGGKLNDGFRDLERQDVPPRWRWLPWSTV